jgi:hypothetical protein
MPLPEYLPVSVASLDADLLDSPQPTAASAMTEAVTTAWENLVLRDM